MAEADKSYHKEKAVRDSNCLLMVISEISKIESNLWPIVGNRRRNIVGSQKRTTRKRSDEYFDVYIIKKLYLTNQHPSSGRHK